jgi:integral membrane protein
MSNPLDRFRLIALAEGVSFIALMGVAMPLKYAAGMPTPVTVVGWIHGVLFILYVVTGTHAAIAGRWSYRFIALAFAASLIPGATFWLDRKLRARPTS